jgi:hypothetical protein
MFRVLAVSLFATFLENLMHGLIFSGVLLVRS